MWFQRGPLFWHEADLSVVPVLPRGDDHVLVTGLGTSDGDPHTLLRILDRILTEEDAYIVPAVGGFLCRRSRLLPTDDGPAPAEIDVHLHAGLHGVCPADIDAEKRPQLRETALRTWLVRTAAEGTVRSHRKPRDPHAVRLLAGDPMLPQGWRGLLENAGGRKRRRCLPSSLPGQLLSVEVVAETTQPE